MKYISQEDMIEVLAEMQGRCSTKSALIHNSKVWDQVKNIPTINIIHCKDCLNFYNNHLCLHWSKFGSIDVAPDDYCSYGELLHKK